MLGRERGVFNASGNATGPHSAPHASNDTPVEDVDGQRCWVNHLQGTLFRNVPPGGVMNCSGGLLAEEMGLGKTVELLALISLHRRPQADYQKVRDLPSDTVVTPSRATLIVTPSSLHQQWMSELARHAPRLAVYHYQGIPTGHQRTAPRVLSVRQLREDYDVVVTTYHILTKELPFAEDPPERNMRHARREHFSARP